MLFISLYGFLIIMSPSAPRLSRGGVPRLTSDNDMCCLTETMISVSTGHIILTQTQPVGDRDRIHDLLTRSRALYLLSYHVPLKAGAVFPHNIFFYSYIFCFFVVVSLYILYVSLKGIQIICVIEQMHETFAKPINCSRFRQSIGHTSFNNKCQNLFFSAFLFLKQRQYLKKINFLLHFIRFC